MLAAVGATVYLLRWELFGAAVRRKAARELGRLLDADAEVGEVSGSLIASVELRRVRIRPRPESPLAGPAEIGRLRLSYRPWALLFSGRPIDRVEVEDAGLVLRANPPTGGASAEALGGRLLGAIRGSPGWPALELRGVSIRRGEVTAGGLAAEIGASGSAERGSARGRLSVRELAIGKFNLGSLTAGGEASWPGGASEVRVGVDLDLEGPLGRVSAALRFPLGRSGAGAPCSLKLSGRAADLRVLSRLLALPETFRDGPPVRAELEFSAGSQVGSLRGTGQLTVQPPPEAGAGPEPVWRVPIGCRGTVLGLGPAELATRYGPLRIGGEIPLGIDLAAVPRPPAATERPGLFAGLTVPDLSRLQADLPGPLSAMRPTGRASVGVRAEGTLLSPEVSAEVEVSGAALRLPEPLAAVEELSARAEFRPGRFALRSLSARMGGGALTASGAVSLIPELSVQGSVRGTNLLVLAPADDSMRLRADADLAVSGGRDGLRLSGRVHVPMAQYYREFVGAASPDAEARVIADREDVISALAIRLPPAAGGGVRLPGIPGGGRVRLDVQVSGSGDLRLENSLLAALLDGRMAIGGTAAEPALSGRLRARSGEVRLFPGVFLPIRELEVELPRARGAEPSARFESQVQAGRVRVFVGISGPLSRPRLRLTSEPPYPQDELLGLLVYGRPPGSSQPGAESAAAMLQAGRLLGGFALDHMPRAEPGETVLSRLALDFESGAERRRDSIWQRQDRGTVTHLEYVINDYLSFIGRREADGRFGGEARLRFAWPRPARQERPAAVPPDGPAPDAAGRAPLPPPVFGGHRAFSERRLLEALAPELERGGGSDWTPALVSDAVFRLRHLYLEAGHCFVSVRARQRDRTVVFSIEEGPAVRLGEVGFLGNREIPEKKLRQALFSDRPAAFSAPFTARLVDAQAASLLAFCREEGYLLARIEKPVLGFDRRRERMNVVYRLREGPRFTLEEVVWRGAPEGQAEALAELGRPDLGRPLRASLPERLATAAREFCRELGRPASRAEAQLELDEAKGTGSLTVEVHPGERVRIRRVLVSGSRRVREKFIRRVSRLREGARLVASRLRSAERRLTDTGLFREAVAVPVGLGGGGERGDGLEPGEVLSDLELRVVEAAPHEAGLRLGYGDFERLGGGVEVGTRNAFGNGESLGVAASANYRGFRLDADAGLFPSPGRPLRAGVHAFYEERRDISFDLRNLGVSPSVSYRPGPRDELTLGLLFEWIDTDDVALGVPAGDQRDFLLGAPFLTLTHDRRDSVLLPSRGYFAGLRLEVADREVYGDISYWRAAGNAAGYLPITRRLTLAGCLQGGVISPFGRTGETPIALRYFAGGAGTVRGFGERELGPQVDGDPVGGELFLAVQTELRFRIWRDLYGAVFLDAGNVWAELGDVDLAELRYGTGPGLRYRTPAGTVGVDVGFNPDRESEDEKRTVLHVTLGLSF